MGQLDKFGKHDCMQAAAAKQASTRTFRSIRGSERRIVKISLDVVHEEKTRSEAASQVVTEAGEEAFAVYEALAEKRHLRQIRKLCDLVATTPEGWRAKARALVAHEPECQNGDGVASWTGAELLASLIRDLVLESDAHEERLVADQEVSPIGGKSRSGDDGPSVPLKQIRRNASDLR